MELDGDVVLTPPAVSESRITGLRYHAGDDAALTAALLRLFSLPEPARRAMGAPGRLPRRLPARLARDGGQAGKPWVPLRLFRRHTQ